MQKKKFKLISSSLLLLMTISVLNVTGEETDTFCYSVPDTVRSLSLVSNGIYTAAAVVGELPDIFICTEDGTIWACQKRASSILFSQDGRYTVVGTYNAVEFYDNSGIVDSTLASVKIFEAVSFTKGQTKTYQMLMPPKPPKPPVIDRSCNPLWTYITQQETKILAISETSSQVLAGAADTLYVIDTQGKLLWKYKADSTITDIEVAGRYIVTSSEKTVYLFNTTGDVLWTYSVNGMPLKLVLSMTGPYVGVGTDSGHIYLIDKNGNLKLDYKNSKAVSGLSITNTGSYLVAGGKDGNILLFNTEGTKLWGYKANGEVNFVDISPKGEYIAAGADRDSYYLLNWNGQKLWSKTNPENYFWSIQVADDGKGLFGGSGNFMGGNQEMKTSNSVCFFSTATLATAGDAPDKNVQTTTPSQTDTITTQSTNKFPLANAGADLEAKVGDAIHFDGTKSTDEDGNIVAYKWDFGDGTSSNDAEPLHKYTNPGTYKLTLTVTDDKGGTGQDVMYATIKDSPSVPKGVPGFELPTVLAGSAFAYYLLSRRKKK